MTHGNPKKHDTMVEHILSGAAPRPSAPEDDREAIFSEVHSQWSALGKSRQRKRGFVIASAIAASFALVLFIFVQPQQSDTPTATVATLLNSAGSLSQSAQGDTWQRLNTHDRVRSGYHLKTAVEGGVFALDSGGNLRLKADTHIVFLDASHIRLESGAVYFDSGSHTKPGKITIQASGGTVQNIGTQFAVQSDESKMRVLVRSGWVSWTTPHAGLTQLAARESGTLSSTGQLTVDQIDSYGDPWAWTEEMTPAFDHSGKKIITLLEWFARETGRSLKFASSEAQKIALTQTIHGSINTASLDELNRTLETVDLTSRFREETIVVSMLQ